MKIHQTLLNGSIKGGDIKINKLKEVRIERAKKKKTMNLVC